MEVVAALRRSAGVASRQRLVALGVPRRSLERAVQHGHVVRVRRGWYALPSIDPWTRAAVRAGGVLTCVSLLALRGVWVPPHAGPPHVALPRHASGRIPTHGTVVHWSAAPLDARHVSDTVVGAIQQVGRCFGLEFAVAAADSALRLGVLDTRHVRGLPAEVRRRVDQSSESGGETLVRLRLRARRIPFRAQVWIDDVGRVDFVVGDRVVIEVDGYAFHGSRDAFERDRARDLALVAAGYLVIRVSQRQIIEDWPRIERSILELVRRRRHRHPRRSPVHSAG